MQYDFISKVVLCGSSGCGKSSLMMNFDGEPFNPENLSTIGVDFKIKHMIGKNGEKVMLQINDTAGQERFEAISSSYFRGASGVLLVFDLTDETSLYKTIKWMENVKTLSPPDTPTILIGNKCDLVSKRVVHSIHANEMAKKLGVDAYYETSAKTGENVEESFSAAMDLILSRQTFQTRMKDSSSGIKSFSIDDPQDLRKRGIFDKLKTWGCNIL